MPGQDIVSIEPATGAILWRQMPGDADTEVAVGDREGSTGYDSIDQDLQVYFVVAGVDAGEIVDGIGIDPNSGTSEFGTCTLRKP